MISLEDLYRIDPDFAGASHASKMLRRLQLALRSALRTLDNPVLLAWARKKLADTERIAKEEYPGLIWDLPTDDPTAKSEEKGEDDDDEEPDPAGL
jgi:hypothetical protein